MKKDKAKNEIIKRKYFKRMKEAKGYSEATIEVIEKALWNYEGYSKDEDFRNFNEKKAKEFKDWLANKQNRGKTITLSTQYARLRHLRAFFVWLSGQNGYKSKINVYDTEYLNLTKKQRKEATSPSYPDYPELKDVKKICDSIEVNNDIDKRDRALIAFTLLSGMRDDAIASLPIGSFDPNKLIVSQNPSKGVRTKFSKHIETTLFKFDEILLEYFLDWYKYLKEVKTYKGTDPLFPRSKVEQISKTNHTYIANSIEPVFWESPSAMRKIFKERFEKAGIQYYSPHKFRHLAVRLSTDHCRSAEQLKAVSQNLGHEHVGTTLLTYGKIHVPQVRNIISNMSFKKTDRDKKLEEVKKLLAEMD